MAHITVPDQNPFAEFTATAGQTDFAITFTIFDPTDIRVTKNGVELAQADFEFTGDTTYEGGYASGTVILDSAASLSDNVRIWSETPPVRINDFIEGAGVPARAANTELDKLTARLRDQRLRFQRIPTKTYSGDTALAVADMGQLFTNEGHSGTRSLTLPAASAGLRCHFAVVVAFSLRALTTGDDVIKDSGSSGTIFASATVGSICEFICVDSGTWLVASKNGTWSLS